MRVLRHTCILVDLGWRIACLGNVDAVVVLLVGHGGLLLMTEQAAVRHVPDPANEGCGLRRIANDISGFGVLG